MKKDDRQINWMVEGKFDKKDLNVDIFGSISGSVLGIIFILLT